MKRFLSFMMALVLLFSMSVNAFAEGETGSITITNATVDDVYSIYKIFDATYNADANGNTNAVSYSITKDNQFFKVMFGEDGKTENPYFTYNATTGAVIRKDGTEDSDIVDYLKGIIQVEGANYTAATEPIKATGQEVKFENLPYGYYIIAKANGAAVTIDSNTPDVKVIDKNQIPTGLTKVIYNEDTNEWVHLTSANVGDTENFKINFIATNYHGDELVKYYTVLDEYDDALQVDFDSFTVTVGGKALTNGQYYIIHTEEGKFKVIIPWMDNYTVSNGNDFSIEFGENAKSIYNATESVEIKYNAVVKNNAEIGANGTNLENKADLEWVYGSKTGEGKEDKTDIKVYALGLNKVDADTEAPLAGAEFEVYRNENGAEKPVNVSKKTGTTDNVYIHDTTSQSNKVVTDATGKIVIIGLEQGTYYLKEVKAPDGYNVLTGEKPSVGIGNVDKAGEVGDFFTYSANSVTVENSKGIELPSTGGEGTMRMITIGSIVAIAFAVLLITNKKMSVYQD